MAELMEVRAAIVVVDAQVVATADCARRSLVDDLGCRTTRTIQRHVEGSRAEHELFSLTFQRVLVFFSSAVHAIWSVRPWDEAVGSGTVRAWAVRHGVVVARAAVLVRIGLETVRAWGVVQGVGSSTDGDTAEGALSGVLAVTAVGSTVAVGVAAVVAGVLGATFGGILVVHGHRVIAVVVDSGGAASTGQTAATCTGTGVDDGSVGVGVRHGAQPAVGGKNAGTAWEVVAVGDAPRGGVSQGTLCQPAARGIFLTEVLDAARAVRVFIAATGSAADTGVDVVGEISDTFAIIRAFRAVNELVQRAADGTTEVVAERQGTVLRALSFVVKLMGVYGSGTVGGGTLDALTLVVVDLASLGGFAALEAGVHGFLVHGAAFVAGLAAHSTKEIGRWLVTVRNAPTGERTRGCVTTAELFGEAALQVVAD